MFSLTSSAIILIGLMLMIFTLFFVVRMLWLSNKKLKVKLHSRRIRDEVQEDVKHLSDDDRYTAGNNWTKRV